MVKSELHWYVHRSTIIKNLVTYLDTTKLFKALCLVDIPITSQMDRGHTH